MERSIYLEKVNKNIFIKRLQEHNIHLTNRELGVAYLMKQGLTNNQIANRLLVAEGTVKVHITHVYSKVGQKRRKEVVAFFNDVFTVNEPV
ncbi:response regulator transcription factor [Virgibacillus sp. FSP13]